MILIHTSASRSASTWMESILLAIGEELDLRCEARGADAYRERVEAGRLGDATLHPAVPLPWEKLALDRFSHSTRIFHVRRDPRDVLVSSYFANRYSHVVNEEVEQVRPILRDCSEEDGLRWLITHRHPEVTAILTSYLGRTKRDGCLSVEFADLVSRPRWNIRRMLRFAGWHLPWRTLTDLIASRSYEHASGGRAPGEEDPHHHYRKGVSGDWKNHFTPSVKALYKDRCGAALIALGYERSLRW